jgi:hypothetical protein
LKFKTINSLNENSPLEDKYWDASQEYYPNEEDMKPAFPTTAILGSFFPRTKGNLQPFHKRR